jgi:DNA-binding NarL/FixJ family response regulator
MPRALIVDDHEIVRKGIRHTLAGAFPGIELGEAGTAVEALAQLAEGTWDVVLLDLGLPGRGGLDLLAELKRVRPRQKVLVVSVFAEGEFALRCIRLGADGYLSKTSGIGAMVAAVGRLLAGGKYVTTAVAERLVETAGGSPEGPAHERLTTRELQVLRLLAGGRSVKEIAAELKLGEHTIATYRARIGEKLGLSTNVELARYALLHGLAE